ncbi:MAG: hypothetical protein KBS64_05180, partial [Treponema sp.]|nr:hypothetical protein [Candidatus Treponema equi]
FNSMASDIVAYAAQKYGQEFFDYIDMNCGAMPDGNFENVIDPSAPQQFLDLYSNMVAKRLDLSCSKLLELDFGYRSALIDYFKTREAENPGLLTVDDNLSQVVSRVISC